MNTVASCAKSYFGALWRAKYLYKQISKYLWIAAILCKEYPIWKKPKSKDIDRQNDLRWFRHHACTIFRHR